ncbi:MAG: choice-of-anchor J domain-containing protein [Chitinophagaceae bacterium]
MRNKFLIGLTLVGTVFFTACKSDAVTEPAAPKDYSWVQDFDSISAAHRQGWVTVNNSKPIGVETWTQAYAYYESKKGLNNGILNPQSYLYSGKDFILATYNCGYNTANISAWLMSPKTMMKNGDQIIFYTGTQVGTGRADRMQVRLNSTNSSDNVGSDSSSVGDFKTVLVDINPTLAKSGPGAYPTSWTRYSITLSGLAAPAERRFAFRYYVTNAGPGGKNSLGIGIDSVAFVSAH